MASDKVHVAELCSALYGFPHIKEDTDVTICCEGQQFLCHRVILGAKSSYFGCMLSKNVWRENLTGSVTFAGDHMRANTLLEILKYIYAGTTSITSSNIVDLLYAGDYLGVLGLEAHCIRNLSQIEPEPIDNLWKAFFSAPSIFNQSFISVLASCNLTERLKKFFNTNEFLRISADHLVVIVTKLWRSPPNMNNILLRAIYRWRAYALDERNEHALKLHKLLDPILENSFELCVISSESFPGVSSDLEKIVAAPQNPSLYVYANNFVYCPDTAYRLKTLRYSCEDPSDEKFVLKHCYQTDLRIRDLRFVSVDNVGLFCIVNGWQRDYSDSFEFRQFASEDIHSFQSGLALAPPPIDTSYWNFDLYNLSDRGLYLLSTMNVGELPHRNLRYDASKQQFSDEEVQRGMYFFNIELDRWLPVPAMRYRPSSSCMTVLDKNVVYVMAGDGNGKIVQAYDHRMRQWQQMPNTLHDHVRPQSCVLDGRIYVSSSRFCERYDPVAARWEDLGFRDSHTYVWRLISYKNQLWRFHIDSKYVEVYTPHTATWSTIQGRLLSGERDAVLDAVIW